MDMKNKIIRVGVIGAGGNIGHTHCENLAKYTEGAVLSAVYDINLEKAAEVAAKYGAKVMDSALDLIHSEEVDAVLVCAWDPTHAELTIRTIGAGKPVFCEKPMATTIADAEDVCDAEKQAGTRLVQMGFMRRFDPDYMEMKRVLDSGELGEPLMIHCISRTRETSVENRQDSMQVTNVAIHEIDICRWLLGENMKEVMVRYPKATSIARGKCHDPQFMMMQSESDVLIGLEATANSYYGYEILCEIVCEKGTIRLPVTPSVQVRSYLHTGHALPADWNDRFVAAYRNELQHWINYLRGLTEIPGPGTEDGYEACRISEALIRAQGSGLWETV